MYLPYYAWIDIGFMQYSDGFGNANVEIIVCINYGNYSMTLNENELAHFFIALRGIDTFANRYWPVLLSSLGRIQSAIPNDEQRVLEPF